jgi:hypothetical protein
MVDDDCAICHIAYHSVVILNAAAATIPSFQMLMFVSPLSPDVVITSSPSARPERPKWMRAA